MNKAKVPNCLPPFFCFATSVFFVCTRLTRTPVHNKDELKGIHGSLAKYNFIDGSKGFHDYTFKLKGHPNQFQIIAEFLNLFKQKEFQKLQYGDTIAIAVSKQDYAQLTINKNKRILVFVIENRRTSFPDANRTFKSTIVFSRIMRRPDFSRWYYNRLFGLPSK